MTFDISPFIKSSDATQINNSLFFQISDQIDPVRNSNVVLYFDDVRPKNFFDPNYIAPPVDNQRFNIIPPVRNAADQIYL
jgi:hypothetical protein